MRLSNTFAFYKDKQSIAKAEFERNVPENWIELIDEHGYFSWGYFWCQYKK